MLRSVRGRSDAAATRCPVRRSLTSYYNGLAFIVCVVALLWFVMNVAAEEPAAEFTPSAEFQTFITSLAREHLPLEYERKKNWGATRTVLDGWDVRLDGLRLDTKRRWKEEEHGVWQQVRITQVDPEERFQVRIERVRELAGGAVACDLTVVARLHCLGKQCQFDRGVQLYAISAEAETAVKLKVAATLRPRLDPATFPPDIVLLAHVDHADLEIHEFRMRRLGRFDGPVVRSLSATVREVLEDKIAADRPKLVAKINQQLEKQQDKLRLRWKDLLETPWGGLAEKLTSAAEK